jgi:hypothetical protein
MSFIRAALSRNPVALSKRCGALVGGAGGGNVSKKTAGRSALASRLLVGMALLVGMIMTAGTVTPTLASASAGSGATPGPDVGDPASLTRPVSVQPRWQGSVLDLHNEYRGQVGVASLDWSISLTVDAQSWADHLAATHDPQHDPTTDEGENLAWGTPGAFTMWQLASLWTAEQPNFIPGEPFGNEASKTGNWVDIGHYTQIIWWNTAAVGCAMASDTSYDYLVCRYAPAGNVWGQYPLGHP